MAMEVVSGTDCGVSGASVSGASVSGASVSGARRTEYRFSVQCKAISLPAFYDAITGPAELTISIVN